LEDAIKTIGLYRAKAKNIIAFAKKLRDVFHGKLPDSIEELQTLPGVGRKTANVIQGVLQGDGKAEGIAVDTHVERVSKRLGICKWKDSVLEVEKTLMKKIPMDKWSDTHHRLIFFGRYHCKAQNPQCESCPLLDMCREGKKRMKRKVK